MAINDLVITEQFMELPLKERQNSMRLLLEFNHYYTSSSAIMRLYNYIDVYSREPDRNKSSSYGGNVPTDFSIYLSFFEAMYLAIITETLDISLVDSLFRFRFFGVCNNPVVQKSELLPLSHQYPNIFDLYNLWCEYLRTSYISNNKSHYFLNEMALFEYDLIKRIAAYDIVYKKEKTQMFRLINSRASKIDLSVKKLCSAHLEECIHLQTYVLSEIKDNSSKNIFEPLTDQEIESILSYGSCFGVFNKDDLIALAMFMENEPSGHTLLNDVPDYMNTSVGEVLVIECIMVKGVYYGYGLQSFFLDIATHHAIDIGAKYVCAVVSPLNKYSSRNMEKYGYRKVATLPKYHSIRDYYLLQLPYEIEANS